MKIVTFGEIMQRLSPPNFKRIEQTETFNVTYGGGEANVAISLSNFGENVYFVSKVPQNSLGQAAINHLNQYGVKTNYIAHGGKRLGVYYLETGVSIRPSQVLYDRNGSSISEAGLNDFDFDDIFKDATWFHFSGITPALSDEMSALTLEACKIAKKHGVTISVDLNYRKKLWTKEKAQHVMKPLMAYVDVCIGNEEDAFHVLGYENASSDINKGQLSMDSYKELQKKMIQDYHFKVVATTLRVSLNASHNQWHALLYDGQAFCESDRYDIYPIVDRVGAGDSFAAGLIYGLIHNKSHQETLAFATAASALKHTIHGDQNLVTIDEIEDILKGNTSGRVKR